MVGVPELGRDGGRSRKSGGVSRSLRQPFFLYSFAPSSSACPTVEKYLGNVSMDLWRPCRTIASFAGSGARFGSKRGKYETGGDHGYSGLMSDSLAMYCWLGPSQLSTAGSTEAASFCGMVRSWRAFFFSRYMHRGHRYARGISPHRDTLQ